MTVKPNTGYYLKTLTLSGKSVSNQTLTSTNGTVSYDEDTNTATITYPAECKAEMVESFKMPMGNVLASATFEATGEPTDKTALSKLIKSYSNLEAEDYTEETWQAYTEKLTAAQAVLDKEDATQAEVNEAGVALEAAYNGLTRKPVDFTALNALITQYKAVTNDGYTTVSWNTFKNALAEAEAVAANTEATRKEVKAAEAALQKAYEGLKKAPQGLWAEWTEDWAEIFDSDNTISYTGAAIKPTVNVYDGAEMLVLKKDYTVSYKKNKNLGTAEVIVTGKGNYSGSDTLNFTIVEKNLTDDDVTIPDLYALTPTKNKAVTLSPVVTIGKTKLKKGRDYTAEYVSQDAATAGIVKGEHDVKIKGIGNYTGERTIKITLADRSSEVLMSSVSISKIPNQTYNAGLPITPDITVKYKKKDVPADNYDVDIVNNTEIGTATVTVTGKGIYIGQKTTTFKITGTALQAKKVTLLGVPKSGYVYNGKAYEPEVEVKVAVKGQAEPSTLREGDDYTVEYSNNVKVGSKATVTVTGINAYSGTVKKTFKITAYDINTDTDNLFTCNEDISVPYVKGGSKPAGDIIEAQFDGTELVQNQDYTLSYANNTKIGNPDDSKAPAVKIKGKGNYKGTKTVKFTITEQQIDAEGLTITAADKLVKSAQKKNGYKVVPVIVDVDGKKLKNNTDFTVTGYYTKDNKEIVNKVETGKETEQIANASLEANDEITVKIAGKGKYAGQTETTFRVLADNHDVSKATITVTPQIYTGKELKPQGSDNVTVKITYKEGGKKVTDTLVEDTHYEITDWSNNVNKGTKAKLTIQGIGEYGGTKTVSFKINAQGMSWADIAAQATSWLKEVFN